jgi:hypothetical protein
VIVREAVMPLILQATPSFEVVWADLEEENADGQGRLNYLDAAAECGHLTWPHRDGLSSRILAPAGW